MKLAAIAFSIAVSAFACAHAQDPVVKVYRVSGAVNGIVTEDSSGKMTEISGLEDETVSDMTSRVPVQEVFTAANEQEVFVTTGDNSEEFGKCLDSAASAAAKLCGGGDNPNSSQSQCRDRQMDINRAACERVEANSGQKQTTTIFSPFGGGQITGEKK